MKVIMHSWVGKWKDGTLGWGLSPFLDSKYVTPGRAPFPLAKGEKCYKVKVTVEIVKDKNGRPIVRRFR